MSGFPPPKPVLDNPFISISPFSLDENFEEEITQSGAPSTAPSSEGESEHSASTDSRPSSPRLTSRPSQGSLSVEQIQPPALDNQGQQSTHTAPVLTPRAMSNSSPPVSSPPTDLPPPLPQPKIGSMAPQVAYPDSGAERLTSSVLSTTSAASSTTLTTTLGRTPPTVTTTTTPAGSSSRVDTDTVETKTSATSFSYRLPELQGVRGKRIIAHSLLAKQLVQAESCGYKKPLKDGSVDAIFRGKVWLKTETDSEGKSITQPEEENAITQFSEPFMAHYFDTPEVKADLDQVTKNYQKQSDAAKKLYDALGAHAFNRDDNVADLMRPVIAPITDYIFGQENSIQTSQMPVAVKAAMLALDEEVQEWYLKNGSGDPEELMRARKNALTGIFGVRSFIPGYAIRLSEDKTVAYGFYRPLSGYLMAYLNKGYEKFLDSVFKCPKGERDRIKREAEVIESRPVLPESDREKLDRLKERFQSRKPNSFLVRLKDAMSSVVNSPNENQPISPRRGLQRRGTKDEKTQPAKDGGPKSPRSVGDSKKSLGGEHSEIRKKKTERDRQAVLHQYLKTLSLNSIEGMTELGDILRGINQKIVNASSDEYKNFKNDPHRFFHGFLRNLIAQIQTRGAAPSAALQRYYINLSDSLGIDDSE